MKPTVKYCFLKASDGDSSPLTNAIQFSRETDADFIAFVDERLETQLNYDYIQQAVADADILHSGLQFGTSPVLEELQITSLSWFFLHTEATHRCVSWKATPHLLIIKRELLSLFSGFNPEYGSDVIRVMDFCYRVLRSGGQVFFDPLLLKTPPNPATYAYPDRDVFLFAVLNLQRKAAVYILVHKLLHSFRWLRILQSFRSALSFPKPRGYFHEGNSVFSFSRPPKRKEITRYSAIIPTLNRYDYLPQAIDSLLQQIVPPAEIIVFDQTDLAKRDESLKAKYDPAIVKFIYSDKKGQSHARNSALQHATHPWCLLFDDDSLAMPDMAKAHIDLLENSDYWVSTGASLAPGQQFSDLSYAINFKHLADVLDTGNCFIHKSIFDKAGYFDMAFNRGPGVDNDFGTRLYLLGIGIIFNAQSLRIHYKASTGGLRTFGVWWRFRSSLFGAYPPPSQTYTIQKYYAPKFWKYLYVRYFLKASHKNSGFQFFLLWLFSPIKIIRSLSEARKLKSNVQ